VPSPSLDQTNLPPRRQALDMRHYCTRSIPAASLRVPEKLLSGDHRARPSGGSIAVRLGRPKPDGRRLFCARIKVVATYKYSSTRPVNAFSLQENIPTESSIFASATASRQERGVTPRQCQRASYDLPPWGDVGALISFRSFIRQIASFTLTAALTAETRPGSLLIKRCSASAGTLPLYARSPRATRPFVASLTALSASLST
jgi:hypothetical protein